MNELATPLDTLCDELNVDLDALMSKVAQGEQNYTPEELKVIQSAIEIAGGY